MVRHATTTRGGGSWVWHAALTGEVGLGKAATAAAAASSGTRCSTSLEAQLLLPRAAANNAEVGLRDGEEGGATGGGGRDLGFEMGAVKNYG